MKLAFVKNSTSKGYLVLGITDGDNKHIYTVSDSVYVEIGTPSRGEEIDGGVFESICYADECYRATATALRLLSYSDNNERTLIAKLLSRGIGKEAAQSAVNEMVRLGYIDEQRQLERLVLREANESLVGPKKLIPKLISKGYSRSDINSVIERLSDSGELDFDENRARLIEKNTARGATDEQIKKILFKKGYTVSE